MPAGQEFIKHEMDEAIAFQQTIVDAETKLASSHPQPDAKKLIRQMASDDKKQLDKLMKAGKPMGATGKKEEVVAAMSTLMQETVEKAGSEESEAYEAHAVLVTLKRKQQDSGSAMVKIGEKMKDADMKALGTELHKSSKASADELAKSLAGLAVQIASA